MTSRLQKKMRVIIYLSEIHVYKYSDYNLSFEGIDFKRTWMLQRLRR